MVRLDLKSKMDIDFLHSRNYTRALLYQARKTIPKVSRTLTSQSKFLIVRNSRGLVEFMEEVLERTVVVENSRAIYSLCIALSNYTIVNLNYQIKFRLCILNLIYQSQKVSCRFIVRRITWL